MRNSCHVSEVLASASTPGEGELFLTFIEYALAARRNCARARVFTRRRLFPGFLFALRGKAGESAQIHLTAVAQAIETKKKCRSSSSLFTEKHVSEFVCGTGERVCVRERSSAPTQQLSPHLRNSSQLLIRCQNSLRLRPFYTTCGVNTQRKN